MQPTAARQAGRSARGGGPSGVPPQARAISIEEQNAAVDLALLEGVIGLVDLG